MMNIIWEKTSIPIKFSLGEFTILKVNLHLCLAKYYFMDIKEGVPTPPGILPSEISGFYFPSYPLANRLKRIKFSSKYIRYISKQYRRFYIDMSLNYSEYLSKFSSKSRSTIRRKVVKFKKESGGLIDFREYKNPDEMRAFYPIALSISKRTYQEKLLGAGLPEDQSFQTEMFRLSENQAVRGYILFLNGIPVAYLYCPVINGCFVYNYLGYDPGFSKLSPGNVLQINVIKHLLSEGGHRAFDFTEGEGQHKKHFSTDYQFCGDVFFLEKRLFFLIFFHTFSICCSRFIVSMLDYFGLKKKIKNFFRFRR
jgi:hypothetical protein